MAYLHHTVIHFPIALTLTAAFFHVLGRIRSNPRWTDVANLMIWLATAAAIIAAGSGLLSASHVLEQGLAADRVGLHRNVALAGTASLLFASVATFAANRRPSPATHATAVGLSLASAAVLSVAAHLGGSMLHPGLAPWSEEPHHHGPAAQTSATPSEDDGHAHEHEPAPSATSNNDAGAGQPATPAVGSAASSPSASAASSAPATKPSSRASGAARPRPPAPTDPHAGHQH